MAISDVQLKNKYYQVFDSSGKKSKRFMKQTLVNYVAFLQISWFLRKTSITRPMMRTLKKLKKSMKPTLVSLELLLVQQ